MDKIGWDEIEWWRPIGFFFILGLIMIILGGLLYFVADDKKETSNYQKTENTIINSKIPYIIADIDEHEYIILTGSSSYGSGICHKANCKFCRKEAE